MPFSSAGFAHSTRHVTLTLQTDQGEQSGEIVYRLGKLATSDGMVLDDWIEHVVDSWEMALNDGTVIPPTKAGFEMATKAGEPIGDWFKLAVMKAIYGDARPNALMKPLSEDTF